MTETKPKTGYWYKFYYDECPVCGRSSSYKERMYTPKPEDISERHVMNMTYDWCEP